MARKALIVKAKRKPKFSTRIQRRCALCGRNRGVSRYFGLCRQHILEMARRGELPGYFKSSK